MFSNAHLQAVKEDGIIWSGAQNKKISHNNSQASQTGKDPLQEQSWYSIENIVQQTLQTDGMVIIIIIAVMFININKI